MKKINVKPLFVAMMLALGSASVSAGDPPSQNWDTGKQGEDVAFKDYVWKGQNGVWADKIGPRTQGAVISGIGNSATISNVTVDVTVGGRQLKAADDPDAAESAAENLAGYYGGRVITSDVASAPGLGTITISDNQLNLRDVTQIQADSGDNSVIRFYGGFAINGTSTTSISLDRNQVNIDQATLLDATIIGAATPKANADLAFSMTGNSVKLTNSKVRTLDIEGASTNNGSISANKVELDNVTVSDTSSGESNYIIGGYTRYGAATDNEVIITDSRLADDFMIWGGQSDASSQNKVTGNKVTIGEHVTNTQGKRLSLYRLFGGYWGQGPVYDNQGALLTTVSDGLGENTLSLYSPVTTRYFGGVQHFEFFLNSDLISSNEAVLEVTGNKVLLEPNQSTITVATVGSAQLSGGDTVKLIDSTNGFVKLDGTALTASDLSNIASADVTLANHVSLARVESTQLAREDYDLLLQDNDTSLVLQIKQDETGTDPGTEPGGDVQPGTDTVNSETDVLMQASIASLASLYASDDLLVDTALKSRAGKRLSGPFAAARAGTWSNDASSRFDTDVYSGLLGWAFSAADVEFGPFVEMRRGNYEMSQGAEGHHNYVGAGVYANWQTPFYVRLTGYLKGGAMENNFHTSLVGQNVDFDNTTAYWGAHLGMNLDIDLTEKFRARPFLSYFYDGRESDSFTQEGAAVDGATFNFDTINAHRVQLGAMFEYAYSETARPYFGITYEHVIKAEAKGTAVDSQGQLSLNSSDIEGATGIVSAGWSYVNPTQEFEFNFGVNGYGGIRNGVSAQMSANWLF